MTEFRSNNAETSRNENLPCSQGRGTALKGGGGVLPTPEPYRKTRKRPETETSPACRGGGPPSRAVEGSSRRWSPFKRRGNVPKQKPPLLAGEGDRRSSGGGEVVPTPEPFQKTQNRPKTKTSPARRGGGPPSRAVERSFRLAAANRYFANSRNKKPPNRWFFVKIGTA